VRKITCSNRKTPHSNRKILKTIYSEYYKQHCEEYENRFNKKLKENNSIKGTLDLTSGPLWLNIDIKEIASKLKMHYLLLYARLTSIFVEKETDKSPEEHYRVKPKEIDQTQKEKLAQVQKAFAEEAQINFNKLVPMLADLEEKHRKEFLWPIGISVLSLIIAIGAFLLQLFFKSNASLLINWK
jgi:hypothetical protein